MPLSQSDLELVLGLGSGQQAGVVQSALQEISRSLEAAGRAAEAGLAKALFMGSGYLKEQVLAMKELKDLASQRSQLEEALYPEVMKVHTLLDDEKETLKEINRAVEDRIKSEARSHREQAAYLNKTKGAGWVEPGEKGLGGLRQSASIYMASGGKAPETDKVGQLLAAGLGGGGLGSIGSMAGEALGGPVGAMIGQYIAKELPGQIAGPFKAVSDSVKTLSSSLQGLQGPLGPIGVGFDLLGEAMTRVGDKVKSIPVVGELLGPLVDSITVLPSVFKQITETLTSFAAKASPGTYKLLAMAVDDVQGVIGQRFIPVVEMMRDVIRTVGDVLQTILPSGEAVRSALAPLRAALSDFSDDMKQLAADLGPILRIAIIGGLNMVSVALKGAADMLRFFTAPLRMMAHVLGLSFGGTQQSSVGAAARPAQFSGFDEYQRQLQQRAFEAGGPSSNTPRNIKSILTVLTELFNWFKTGFWERLPGALAAAASAAKAAVGNKVTSAVQAAANSTGTSPAARFGRGIGQAMGGGPGSFIGGAMGGA